VIALTCELKAAGDHKGPKLPPDVSEDMELRRQLANCILQEMNRALGTPESAQHTPSDTHSDADSFWLPVG
jgi:hypothetical protein